MPLTRERYVFTLLALCFPSSLSLSVQPSRSQKRSLKHVSRVPYLKLCLDGRNSPLPPVTTSRRNVLSLTGSILASGIFNSMITRPASAASTSSKEDGIVSTDTVANLLHNIPTFVLVDSKGVPYTVVGEDAKVTGYFFTTYGEASRLLKLARESSEKSRKEALAYLRQRRRESNLAPLSSKEEIDEVGRNPWEGARISTVPLDFAATLFIKSQTEGKKSNSKVYFKIAAAEVDIEDALSVDKSVKELAEGKVPLFYFEDFVKQGANGLKQSPLYFRKSELLEDWKRSNPSETTQPPVRVTELFTVITEMVKPGGTDEDLSTIAFVSPKESSQKAKDCLKAGGSEAAFKVGQTIVVL